MFPLFECSVFRTSLYLYHTTVGQGGSEIRTSLDFEWAKRGWVANGADSEWEAQPFENQINFCYFVKNHLKLGQKCPDFKWSGFQMVGTKAIVIIKAPPFENRTI